MAGKFRTREPMLVRIAICLAALLFTAGETACAQSTSVSAWDAADFRAWSFIPYWIPNSQIISFGTNRAYDHLSDVVYHAGAQPRADGVLMTTSTVNAHLATIKAQQAQFGFRYHTSLYDAVENPGESAGVAVERVWNAITANPTTRATFVSNVKTFLTNNNMTGVNLDWERPNTVAEWANYTQLAKDLQAAFPDDWEVSVDDYGFADSRWDDSPVFDARTYDQIGIMGYHYPANNGTSLDQQSFADGKKALTGQGAEKAFKDSQMLIGMGMWGAGSPNVGLKDIVAVNPSLPAQASSFTGTVNGSTGTWDIVSRYEVRDNVQLALDRGMAGVMFWALSHDATNKMSLARVAQHYAMVKRGVPDLNLDGKVGAADATALADNMGTVPGWTGMATAAQFEAFYMSGNWEQGDHDGNGFVNQADADWLAGRFAALGVALPDRLAYTGSFEKFGNLPSSTTSRWQAVRNASAQLPETGNYAQHNTGTFSFNGTGPGAGLYSTESVTIRNQNSAENFDNLNVEVRKMRRALSYSIDLGEERETYFTFLVRQNSAPLLPGQLSSPNRTLALEMLDEAGQNQFNFILYGQQSDFGLRSQADAAGQDVTADGFGADATYLFVGKISGNGAGANTMQASLFAPGSSVGNFSAPEFPWMLTAHGSDGFNPTITHLQFTSQFVGNYTVSNVVVGDIDDFFGPATPGDFNDDGIIDAADFARWRSGFGGSNATHWRGDADGDADVDGADFLTWQRQLGSGVAAASRSIPEPASIAMFLAAMLAIYGRPR